MKYGKDSACNAVPFAKSHIASGLDTNNQENNTKSFSAIQWFSIPSHHKKRAYQITTVLDRLKMAYEFPQNTLKTLQHHLKRQVRSTRRKTMLDALRYMIYWMDDATLRVGRQFENGKWSDKTIEEIAGAINASIIAVKRALGDLIKKGYLLSVKQYEERQDGSMRALPSIRSLTPKIFLELEIEWEKMFRLKQYKIEQRRKRQQKEERKISQSMKDLLSKVLNVAKPGLKSFSKPDQHKSQSLCGITPEQRQNLNHRALEMYQRDPSKKPSDYLKELLQPYQQS